MYCRSLCLVVLLLAHVSRLEGLEVAAVAQAELGEYRKLVVAAAPSFTTPYGFAIAGAKYQVSGTTGQLSGAVNAAKFALANPALKADQTLGFYFGVLQASGTLDLNASTVNIQGAFAEVFAGFLDVFVWFNNDGKPGLQYKLGDDIECPALGTPTTDCIEKSLTISLQTLTWSPFAYTNTSCPAGNYQPDCRVHSFTTSGTLLGAGVVATFVFNVASEPVLVNQVKVGPDYGKIDVTIAYPWTQKPTTKANPRVGLLSAIAGKAAAATYRGATGSSSLTWVGTGADTTFSWSSEASISNQQVTVYHTQVTSGDLDTYKCVGTDAVCAIPNIRVAFLKAYAAVYRAFGWETALVWFTWDEVRPASVYWDPALSSTSTSSSAVMTVSIVTVLAACAASLFQ